MRELNPEARRIRARLAAYKRWHPDDGPGALDALTTEAMRELNRDEPTQAGLDERIDAIVGSAPLLTPAQLERLRRLFGTDAGTPAEDAGQVAS
jgi:predicted metal-dependent phosphoesterase TrpH